MSVQEQSISRLSLARRLYVFALATTYGSERPMEGFSTCFNVIVLVHAIRSAHHDIAICRLAGQSGSGC